MATRRKNGDFEDFAQGVLIIWMLWAAWKLLEIYHSNQYAFYVVVVTSVLLISGIIWMVLRHRERKWLAIRNIEDMHRLHWRDFEKFVAFILNRKGFKTRLWNWSKDGGIDIYGTLQGRKYLIQCKKWQTFKVSEPKVREFFWAMKDFDERAKWIYVTTSELTADAISFAHRNSIEIWDKDYLCEFIQTYSDLKDSTRTDFWNNESIDVLRKCEKCWGDMIERIAKRWSNKGERFLGCKNFPKCMNIIPIREIGDSESISWSL